jgi:hypothetical protein
MDKAPTRPTDSRRRRLMLGAAGIALPFGLTGCATGSNSAGSGRQFAPPQVRPGDRWLYVEINRYNGLPLANVEVTVTNSYPLTCSVRRTRTDSTAGEIMRPNAVQEERYSEPWTVDVEPIYDLTLDFEQPMPILPSSLRVGALDSRATSYTVKGYSGRYRWSQRLRAVGAERLVTPAGSFDCLRVQRTIWFDYPDVFRFGSARVDDAWYAPEVNRWVRREWTGDYQHENSFGKMGTRRREDWVRWDLLSYQPGAAPAG